MTSHTIYSRIDRGADPIPLPTPVSEVLTDWFGLWLSQHSPATRPSTVRDFLTKVLPIRTWVPFAVGDGTYLQHSDNNKNIRRRLRFTIVSTPETPSRASAFPADAPVGNIDAIAGGAFHEPTICVVASSNLDRPDVFLQVASWDATKRRLNFYERMRKSVGYDDSSTALAEGVDAEVDKVPIWLYVGSSFDAFAPDTEGRGPFCGHVNGALVMKELSNPWMHWHSTRYSIRRTFALDDPLLSEELLQPPNRHGGLTYIALGDRFEEITRTGIIEWYNSRLESDFGPRGSRHTTAANIVSWMRHLLTTTTVNMAGSSVNSDIIIAEESNALIPQGFFYNNWALGDNLPHEIQIPMPGEVKSAFYNAARIKLGLKTIYDWRNMGVAFDDEGQAPWCVIVPSLEDRHGVNRINHLHLLSTMEILSLLMIDFPNPVYSCRRERLLQYIPATSTLTDGTYDLSDSFRTSISDSIASQDPSSPESEFLRNLSSSGSEFETRIAAYMAKVSERVQTPAGVEDYMLLAESRRRIFRPYPSSQGGCTNPLSEFSKTLPYATLIPKDWKHLEMTEDAAVRVMDEDGQQYVGRKIAERYKVTPKQCHTDDAGAGCPY